MRKSGAICQLKATRAASQDASQDANHRQATLTIVIEITPNDDDKHERFPWKLGLQN